MVTVVGLIIVWFYVLNEGRLIITTGLNNYTIYTNNEPVKCPTDPCEIKLDVGNYQIRFEKEGYNTASSKTTISRGGVSGIKFDPKKVMKIEPISIVPKTDKPTPPIPTDLNADNIITHIWNKESDKFLFLDTSDNRLKIRKSDGQTNLITTLKNIAPPINLYWSPDEKYILVSKENDLYYIEIEMGSRKKYILDFEPTRISWSPASNFFLMNDSDNSLYKIDWEDQKSINKIDMTLDLSESTWINENTLITYKTDSAKNLTKIWTYNPSELIQESITQKFDFPLDQISYDPIQGTVYFHNSREGGWYEMKL